MTDKNYMVLDSNGKEIKTVKSLSIAKKMANSEKGSVVCDGECVYQVPLEPEKSETAGPETAEPETAKPEIYRIKELMNVRSAPSLKAEKLGTISPGTDVEVLALEDDWLHLVNGTFIFYDNGKYAERMCRE